MEKPAIATRSSEQRARPQNSNSELECLDTAVDGLVGSIGVGYTPQVQAMSMDRLCFNATRMLVASLFSHMVCLWVDPAFLYHTTCHIEGLVGMVSSYSV